MWKFLLSTSQRLETSIDAICRDVLVSMFIAKLCDVSKVLHRPFIATHVYRAILTHKCKRIEDVVDVSVVELAYDWNSVII